MRHGIIKSLVLGALALSSLGLGGCKPYKLEPPAGFAEVDAWDYGARMKGAGDVGLNVAVFENNKGGTLAFWSADLVHKLGERGYVLDRQTEAKSKNGVTGTRFDFRYTPVGEEQERFYSAVLFVTDEYRVVVQVAGGADQVAQYSQQIDQIARATKARGCKPFKKTCKGPQPDALSTPPPKPAAPDGADPSPPDSDTQLADK